MRDDLGGGRTIREIIFGKIFENVNASDTEVSMRAFLETSMNDKFKTYAI